MKKSLIALAVLAASGAAMAQSSVTMFGIVDVGVGYLSATNSVNGVTSSGLSSSRLGFRGVEDLGGGLKAGFWLEGAVSPDVGTGAGGGASGPGFEFKRRSTISLMGNFGELRLGRELTAGYDKPSSYDPFGQVGIGQFQGWGAVGNGAANFIGSPTRVGNGISYRTPAMGGFFVNAHYGFGEVAGSNKAGRYIGVAGGYDNGPLSVTVAGDQLNSGLNSNYDVKSVSVGASYDLGVVKPAFIYHTEKNEFVKYNNYMVAVSAPVGPGELKASYQRIDLRNSSADTDVLAIGYVYNLSKRTAVYGTLAHAKNKGGANRGLPTAGLSSPAVAANENVNGFQAGIRHAF